MKREDLKKIEGLSEEAINQIMALHHTDVSSWNEKFDTQQSAIAERESRLSEMTTKYAQYEGVDVKKLQKDYADLQNKYTSDMTAKEREYAKSKLFDGVKWTSSLAKQGAMAEFESKGLEFKDGRFEGADAFFNDLKSSNPEAFEETKGVGSTGFEHGGSPLGEEMSGVEKAFYKLNPDIKK